MREQLKHEVIWSRRKIFLLFVLILSIALIQVSLYLFTSKNKWLQEQFIKSGEGLARPNDSCTGWAFALSGIAIFLIVCAIVYLLQQIRRQKVINNRLRIQKEHYRNTIDSIGEGLITSGKQTEILKYKLRRILRKGEAPGAETNILLNTRNQRTPIFSDSRSSFFNSNGHSPESVPVSDNIAKKTNTERKPDESDLLYKGILDALNSHIAVINSSGVIVKVNKSWNTFILNNGVANLEKYGEGANYYAICKALGNASNGACVKALDGIKKVFDGSRNEFYFEYPSHSITEKKWFYLRAMKFESAETLVVIEHHDITERKKAEEKTLKAIEQYDILSQATSDTIWDWDIPDNQIVYNEGIVKMFGYKISEVENAVEWWQKNIHPDDLKGVSAALGDVFKKGVQNLQLQYRFRSANGSFKYIYDRAFVIYDENGGPTRIIGAMQDVTYEKEEEKRIAKTIIDAQERERRYIGQELHDNINQVLAGALLTIAMAKQKQIDTERVTELINLSEEYLVHAIDEVRKLSHRLAPASFEETTLKDIFEDMLLKINLDNHFKIHFHFEEIINVLISEDIQINLYRILQEQVKNILKYSAATTIEVTVSLAENTVKMRTFDNGKGFDLKTVKKGIGISNIKKRVESFSGKYILNSAPGKGCEIIVEIPLDIA